MGKKEYIVPYIEDAGKRHYHQTYRGKVTKFMVQLEVKCEGIWREVVRYDCAHGYVHRDSYNLRNERRKEELYLTFGDAITLADDDIDENWEIYKDTFLKGNIP